MYLSDNHPIPGATEEIDGGNREIRQPCILLIDVSGSMSGEPLNSVNRAMPLLAEELNGDPLARQRVEIAILAFSDSTEVIQDFATPRNFRPPSLQPVGGTQMGQALKTGLLHLNRRIELYKMNGLNYYKPWMFFISDGCAGDCIEGARKDVHHAEKNEGLQLFPIGVEGADFAVLSSLSANRDAVKLKGLRFAEFFRWISISMRAVSTSLPGDRIRLQDTSGWGEIQV